jgi:protein SDA1
VFATLKAQSSALDPDLRMALVKAVVSLRNKSLVDQDQTLDLFFDLLKCDDKQLRKFILGAFISFIRAHHRKFRRADTKMQTYVYSKLKDPRLVVAHIAQLLAVDSFRRGFWRDSKTANVVAETIFNPHSKIHV